MIDLVLSDEVAAARADGTPVVALESTIITHGMPHPQNVEVARQCLNASRSTEILIARTQ